MNRRRVRAGIELLFAKLALRVIPSLSRPMLRRLARVLAHAAQRWGGDRTCRVALANLALVFPERSEMERKQILRESLETFALAMLDVFWLARGTQEKISGLVQLDPTYAVLAKPGPMICVTAHMGNWELLGMAVSHQTGQPLTSVAARLKNHRVDALFNELRRVTGQQVVPRRGAVRPLLKALRDGQKIALVLDQNTKPIEGGVFVDFLGRPAPVSTAAALLALRTGAPLVVGFAIPTPEARYRTLPLVSINREGLPTDTEEATRVLTQRIADVLSATIRQHPGFWVWSYKRWKIRPPDSRAEDFPYYARPLQPSDLPANERVG